MSENFGLAYEGIFDGSMYGAGPTVYAVWFYVIANGYGGQVTLNPRKLADNLGATLEDVEAAIELHCAPDPKSRTQTDEGRRLRHLGGFTYEVVNHDLYKSARALEEKRAYDRQKKRESRERRSTTDVPIFDQSKKSLTDADPLLSSPSDLILSDPEGVQGEPPAPPAPEPSRRAPADFAPTDAQRALCRELGHDVDKLVRKFTRHEFPRPLTDWQARFDTWIDDQRAPERPPKPPSSAPPKKPQPPWVDDVHILFAREHGLDLTALAKAYGKLVPTRGMGLDEARAGLSRFLAEQARSVAA
jgi:hypothetical protein